MAGRGQAARPKPAAWDGHIISRDLKKVWVDDQDAVGCLCLDAAQSSARQFDFDLAKSLKGCVDFIVESVYEVDGTAWLPSILLLARTGRAYGLTLGEYESRLQSVLEKVPQLSGIQNDGIELEVMTTHKAKGKEADTVIILEATSKQFPKVHADNQLFGPFNVTIEDTLAEERRLFYVAVTRAKHRLLLLSEAGCESLFLEELELSKDSAHPGGAQVESYVKAVELGDVARSIRARLA